MLFSENDVIKKIYDNKRVCHIRLKILTAVVKILKLKRWLKKEEEALRTQTKHGFISQKSNNIGKLYKS